MDLVEKDQERRDGGASINALPRRGERALLPKAGRGGKQPLTLGTFKNPNVACDSPGLSGGAKRKFLRKGIGGQKSKSAGVAVGVEKMGT